MSRERFAASSFFYGSVTSTRTWDGDFTLEDKDKYNDYSHTPSLMAKTNMSEEVFVEDVSSKTRTRTKT